MRASSNQSQLPRLWVTTLVVYEQPIRFDMAFASPRVLARQFVITVFLVKQTVVHLLFDDGPHLFPVIPPRMLDTFFIGFELTRFFERS